MCSDVCGDERVSSGIHTKTTDANPGQPFLVCRAHEGAQLRYGFQIHGGSYCAYYGTVAESNWDCLCRNGKVELELKNGNIQVEQIRPLHGNKCPAYRVIFKKIGRRYGT